VEWGRGPPTLIYLDISVWVSEFLVTPLLKGPVYLVSHVRFEDPLWK